MTDIRPMNPSDAFAQLGRLRLGRSGIDDVLRLVADLAKQTVPGATDVSVTLVRGKAAHSAAFTGDLALTLDTWQYERGDGPCLAAIEAAATLSVPDTTDESRWPDWATRCRAAGVFSSLSVGLPIHESVKCGLNIYGAEPHAFDEHAIALGQTFADYAAVALANAHLYDAQTTLAQHMRAAMETRAVIEQAKGIIMGERRCTADEALAVLTKTAQEADVELRDVAAALAAHAAATPRPRSR
jgi:GAF domain-containing protein